MHIFSTINLDFFLDANVQCPHFDIINWTLQCA